MPSTTLSPEALTALIERLNTHIAIECRAVDLEERLDQMLNDCYSFKDIGGPFASMDPARVLREMDPVAYRCALSDMSDGDGLLEVDGDTYEERDVESAKESFLDDLRSDLDDAEKELAELEGQPEGEDSDADSITEARATVARLEAEVAAIEAHSF